MQTDESYRDRISTIDREGKRVWIFPKRPHGRFTNYRRWVSIFLLAILLAGPFITLSGQPLLMLNVLERQFVIFGQVFWPQDFHLAVVGMIASIVFIILFTVAFGRIFCGWVCPQTIFMEWVFRRVEYWIEGDYMKQKKLRKQSWDKVKTIKKTVKHALFLLISALIMHTFMAYIIGLGATWRLIRMGPSEEPVAFVGMVVLTGLFYGVFSKMREQVCTTICPYGRLQGVLLDRKSVVVAYDYVRGEERGILRKNEDRPKAGLGDCIDCHQCVQVCPTGIDIRNGTQLECVNCTACIDACDSIMDKVRRPRGLVRYASEENIAEAKPFRLTGRMKAYALALVAVLGVLVALLMLRSDIETTILRTPGMTYQEDAEGNVTNLYQLKVVNKTNQPVDLKMRLQRPEGELRMVGENMQLQAQKVGSGAFFIAMDKGQLTGLSTDIRIDIYANGEWVETIKTRFLGPGY